MDFDALRDADRRAVLASIAAAAGATVADLRRLTPCAGWTLADLLTHMTGQQRGFARAARGDATARADWSPTPLGKDAVASYTVASRDVIAAFAEPGVADTGFLLPEIRDGGPFPAAQAIGFHLVDNVVHAWDVAAALGVPTPDLDGEVLDVALAVAREVPGGAARLRPDAAFAPGLPVPGDATALDEILLLLGRPPRWRATASVRAQA